MSSTTPQVDPTPNAGDPPPTCSYWVEGDPSKPFFTGTFPAVAAEYLRFVEAFEAKSSGHEYPWVQFRGAVLVVDLPWAEGLAATEVAVRAAVERYAGHPVQGLLASDWRATTTSPGWTMALALDREVEADELPAVLTGLRRAMRAAKALAPDPVADVSDDGSTVTWSTRLHARYAPIHKAWRSWARVVRWADPGAAPLSVDRLVSDGDGAPGHSGSATVLGADTLFTAGGISYTVSEFFSKTAVGGQARGKCWGIGSTKSTHRSFYPRRPAHRKPLDGGRTPWIPQVQRPPRAPTA